MPATPPSPAPNEALAGSVASPSWPARAGILATGLAVAFGAFGAHALEDVVPETDLAIWRTAVRYLAWHGLALFALPTVAERIGMRSPGAVAVCWTAGAGVFAGSLFALVLSGVRVLGAVTPIGGVLMLAGWALALRARPR